MSTNTITKFVVYGAWNRFDRMFLASEYATGVINFKAFETKSEAQAELENWLQSFDGCTKVTAEQISDEYADYVRDNQEEDDQLESLEEYSQRNYPHGEGWYKNGYFIGDVNEELYHFDRNCTGIAEVEVTVTEDEEDGPLTTYKWEQHLFTVNKYGINC